MAKENNVEKKKSTKKSSSTSNKNTSVKKSVSTKKTMPIQKNNEVKIQEQKETNVTLTVLGIIILVIVAIIIFNLTYAFFTARIKDENPNATNTQIISANLLVRYIDGGSNMELDSKIQPGDKIIKEFSVINEGNDTGYYTIVLDDLINNFSVVCPSEEEPDNGEINFALYSVDAEGNELSTLSMGKIPCVTTASRLILYTQDAVLKDKTNYYRLEIEYINLSIDQSDNMDNGKLSAQIDIIESSEERRTAPTSKN